MRAACACRRLALDRQWCLRLWPPGPLAAVQGKQLVFVTNNSTKSRAGYLKKFTGLGLDVKAEEIYSSSYAAAAYLESIQFPQDKKVYVVGEVGIQVRRRRIAAGGCTRLTLAPPPHIHNSPATQPVVPATTNACGLHLLLCATDTWHTSSVASVLRRKSWT